MIYDEFPDPKSIEVQLFNAIDANNLDRAFDLINAGANLAALDWFGWTMLRTCLSYEMVELLILHGADPDQVDGMGNSVRINGAHEIKEFIERAQVGLAWQKLAETTPVANATSLRRF